ncbi:MAG: ROK family protein [Oscillospiraceae bacterium]
MKKYIVGIDVGGTNVKIMAMSTEFEVVGFSSIKTNGHLGYEVISDNIISEIDLIFRENHINNPKILSIAMGLPGTVYKREQKTGFLSVLMWNGFNPAEKIGRHYNAKFCIENDANLNALGEYTFGIKKSVENLVLVTLGTGVGCGIISEGKLFGGSNNQAAEIGHMTVVTDDGEKCLC